MGAGCFNHQDLVSDGLEICAEVYATFDHYNSLLSRFDPKVGKDRLIQALASDRANHNTHIGRGIQYP